MSSAIPFHYYSKSHDGLSSGIPYVSFAETTVELVIPTVFRKVFVYVFLIRPAPQSADTLVALFCI